MEETKEMEETKAADRARHEETRESSQRFGVNIAGRIIAGEPVPEIIRRVEQNGHDLVVVPAALQRAVRGKLVGIPIVPLMRDCPCPVWVLKPTPALHGGILVAVNPGSAEDQDGAFSRSLIRMAACVARAAGSQLSILHVWHLTGEPQIRRPVVGARPERIETLLGTAYKRAATDMQRLLDTMDLGDTQYKLYLEEAQQPAKAIAEFAVRNQIGTVVMGMMGRGGLAGLLVGNSAEEVLRGVPCSVVTLRSGYSFPRVDPQEGLPAVKKPAATNSRTRWATESTSRMKQTV
jgi:nucleotide-binding universal stress UspA family protein